MRDLDISHKADNPEQTRCKTMVKSEELKTSDNSSSSAEDDENEGQRTADKEMELVKEAAKEERRSARIGAMRTSKIGTYNDMEPTIQEPFITKAALYSTVRDAEPTKNMGGTGSEDDSPRVSKVKNKRISRERQGARRHRGGLKDDTPDDSKPLPRTTSQKIRRYGVEDLDVQEPSFDDHNEGDIVGIGVTGEVAQVLTSTSMARKSQELLPEEGNHTVLRTSNMETNGSNEKERRNDSREATRPDSFSTSRSSGLEDSGLRSLVPPSSRLEGKSDDQSLGTDEDDRSDGGHHQGSFVNRKSRGGGRRSKGSRTTARASNTSKNGMDGKERRNDSHEAIGPGAFAVSQSNGRSDSGLQSLESAPALLEQRSDAIQQNNDGTYQVKAILVEPDNDQHPYDVEQNIRQQILADAVEADVVDTEKMNRGICCKFFIILTIVALAVGLSVGLTAENRLQTVVFVNKTDSPTQSPSSSPTQAPTQLTVSLCSPWTYVDDESRYALTYAFLLDNLPPEYKEELENSADVCHPYRVSTFQVATLLGPDETFSPDELARLPIIPSTRLGLGAFYFLTKGENWIRNDGWLADLNYCTWYGITCGFGYSITKLELVNNGLDGFIPPDASELSRIGTS